MRLLAVFLSLLLGACTEALPPTSEAPNTRLTLADGAHYQGALQEGLLHGDGVLARPDGSVYQGMFANGLFHGTGVWRDHSGALYAGEFERGVLQGLGQISYPDGSQAQGEFVDAKLHGQGVWLDALGNRFAGHFTDGVLQGAGVYTGADGDHYVGRFQDQRFAGLGIYTDTLGNRWHGQFVHGAAHGEGRYTGVNLEQYSGTFKRWRYQGNGRLTRADGSRYVGEFKAGQLHGAGRMIDSHGKIQSGIWYKGRRVRDEQGQPIADPLELALLQQGPLLEKTLAQIPFSSPQPDLYVLVLAGDGQQAVFQKEVQTISDILTERFAPYSLTRLINQPEASNHWPMATTENLRQSIQVLAERSQAEDVLLIYLTSHGSADHQLAIAQPGIELSHLPADTLKTLLAPLAERKKILIISACYSGGFIEPLKDANTLIMTAARADRTSFGCSDDSDFTYFGRALFAQALTHTDNWQNAFERAKEHVNEWETQEALTPSEPQIWLAPEVVKHWQALRNQIQPTQPLQDTP